MTTDCSSPVRKKIIAPMKYKTPPRDSRMMCPTLQRPSFKRSLHMSDTKSRIVDASTIECANTLFNLPGCDMYYGDTTGKTLCRDQTGDTDVFIDIKFSTLEKAKKKLKSNSNGICIYKEDCAYVVRIMNDICATPISAIEGLDLLYVNSYYKRRKLWVITKVWGNRPQINKRGSVRQVYSLSNGEFKVKLYHYTCDILEFTDEDRCSNCLHKHFHGRCFKGRVTYALQCDLP
jgi:hypothetical protein